ncbi:tRNA (adenosine(37)-N6)-dimethylallyltransferase MiaA [soil metagenome]
MALASRFGGAEIVSADSRQVFRGMDIGTAKPSPADRAAAPHHGLDLVAPDEPFSAADFRRHALLALEGIAARGGLALLVGGTGLYLRAVARGLPLERSGSDPDVRRELEARLASEGLADLAAELDRLDPGAAGSVDHANPRRVVRALERAIVTGSAAPPEPLGYGAPVLWLGLRVPDAVHREAIAERARRQFEAGLLDEAAGLGARFDEALPAFSAMGYREAFDVLAGRSDVATAVERTIARSVAYARRQRTWFRSEPGVTWLDPGEGGSVAAATDLMGRFLRAAAGSWSRADYPVAT